MSSAATAATPPLASTCQASRVSPFENSRLVARLGRGADAAEQRRGHEEGAERAEPPRAAADEDDGADRGRGEGARRRQRAASPGERRDAAAQDEGENDAEDERASHARTLSRRARG